MKNINLKKSEFILAICFAIILSIGFTVQLQAKDGWCCVNGQVFQSSDAQCKEKGGTFYLTKEEALKNCQPEDGGWCCIIIE